MKAFDLVCIRMVWQRDIIRYFRERSLQKFLKPMALFYRSRLTRQPLLPS